MRNKVPV